MLSAASWLVLILAHNVASRTIQFYIEPTQKVVPTYVQQLVEGKMDKIDQGVRQTASVSLVYDSGYYIIVDTPSATDVSSKEHMLRGISSRNIVPGEVQLVVNTHGHPDHFGQGNFFPNARHFFGSYEYADDIFISTELSKNATMKISTNVEIWNTPGHTNQDISVIVHNVPCCGTVAVVGDLFYSEKDVLNGTEWFADAWNPLVGKLNRDKVLCYSNYIIPGHGKLFKITDEMKKAASCGEPINEVDNDSDSTVAPLFPVASTEAPEPEASSTSMIPPAPVRPTTSSSTIPETTTPFFITVDQLPELETPPPEIRDLVKSVKQAVPYVLQNVVEPAALELKKSAHKIPKINESEIAPAVENAAIHFSRLIQNQAYMENPNLQKRTEPSTEYPYMTYWQNMLKKIANEVPQIQEVISSITTPNKTVRGTFHRQPSLNMSTAKPNQISSLIQRLCNPPYQSLNNGAPN